jgi:hypothetical protein
MKGYITLLILISMMFLSRVSSAQSIEVLGGNILNGAMTGSMLGAATMGLQNSNDFTPLRIGVGAGTIAGAGIGIYDIATLQRGEMFFISGIFNDGNNTSIIILLDTFYGAAAGAVLGSAGMLIADKPIVDGLQYGSSAGAWIGFTFGLVDAFGFAQRNRDFVSSNLLNKDALYETRLGNSTIGIGRPGVSSFTDISDGRMTTKYQPVMGVLTLSVEL